MFKKARANKISNNIINQIRMAISEGKLKPGDKLPSEKALIREFHVSKVTLREALRSLEILGF
jgi:GntR family transcriptional repressor for pyruvate dehydrogenase complex